MYDERRESVSLFTLRREYQRSFDRIFEDLSVYSRAHTERSYPEEVETNRQRPVISLGNQLGSHEQSEIRNVITPKVANEYDLIQHDVKAWGRFLDSKHKE